MRQIKLPGTLSLEEEDFQTLSRKGFIIESIIVDALFNENVENALDLDGLLQEYFKLDLTVRKLMKYTKTELLEYKILKILESNGGVIRLKDLTNALDYVRASIHQALKTLREKKFLLKVDKGSYVLTDEGRTYLEQKINES
ncbi:MAG: hypothetical protein ACTSRW_01250 [Candidatus Helarchaeota archaeon]